MKSAKKKEKRFIAVVEEDAVENISQVADELKEQGIQVDQVLSLSGVITGASDDFEKVAAVKGIRSVEEDKEKHAW